MVWKNVSSCSVSSLILESVCLQQTKTMNLFGENADQGQNLRNVSTGGKIHNDIVHGRWEVVLNLYLPVVLGLFSDDLAERLRLLDNDSLHEVPLLGGHPHLGKGAHHPLSLVLPNLAVANGHSDWRTCNMICSLFHL